jgi:hypothetical protein
MNESEGPKAQKATQFAEADRPGSRTAHFPMEKEKLIVKPNDEKRDPS